jgi:hypothetical protein
LIQSSKLNTNEVNTFFDRDTLQKFQPGGTTKMKLSCANGWWVNLEVDNDCKERRIQIIPIDTKNQKPCKKDGNPEAAVQLQLL